MELKKIVLCDGNEAIEITFDVTDDFDAAMKELFPNLRKNTKENDDGDLEER